MSVQIEAAKANLRELVKSDSVTEAALLIGTAQTQALIAIAEQLEITNRGRGYIE